MIGCQNDKVKRENKTEYSTEIENEKINVRLGNFTTIPKTDFELNSYIEDNSDTLKIVTCSDFVYEPFGKIKTKNDLKNSFLKNLSFIDRIDTLDNEADAFEFQILQNNQNKLILFFNNSDEGVRESYVQKAEIINNEIHLEKGIKINMSKQNFFLTFYNEFPLKLINKYNIVSFISCVDGVIQNFNFRKGKLKFIEIKTIGNWNIPFEKKTNP